MRLFLSILATVAVLTFASAASADLEFDGTDQALMGLNGVVTSVADPFVGLIDGDPRLGEPPYVAPVTNRVVGLFTGTFTALHRGFFGAADIAMAVFPVTHLSPDPLFVVIPGAPEISEPPVGF